MKCGRYCERAAGPQGLGGVPLDRNPGELLICREGWNGKVVGSEGFQKSSVELILHAGRFREVIPERVEDGPILRAQVKDTKCPVLLCHGPQQVGMVAWVETPGGGKC